MSGRSGGVPSGPRGPGPLGRSLWAHVTGGWAGEAWRRAAAAGRPGLEVALAGLTGVSLLGLALTGAALFLVVTVIGVLLLWSLEQARARERAAIAPVASPPPPPHAPPSPALSPVAPRSRRHLSYEETLGELMQLAGARVTVYAAPREQPRGSPVAARLCGVLGPGSLREAEEQEGRHHRTGRGLFFPIDEQGSGFFLPAVEFVGAHRGPHEVLIRLRDYVVAIRTSGERATPA